MRGTGGSPFGRLRRLTTNEKIGLLRAEYGAGVH